MRASDLKAEQAEKLCRDVQRQIRYFDRLCARMQKLRWADDDPLYQAIWKARDALGRVHFRALSAGPPPPPPGPKLHS